ncbi:3-oxoacyl-[acyl-carrier-protein] reductase [soil metagenome]
MTGSADRHLAGEPRTVVVTGGTRGIGLACARSFAEAGDRVAVLSRSGLLATGTSPSGVAEAFLSLACDVADSDQVDAAFTKIEAELGPAQVVVANAGITRDTLLARMSEKDFTVVVDANLTGAFRVARRAVGPMMRARWGRMVFVSSVVAHVGGPGQANYAASKAGLVGLARSIAREYATRSITANVVSPGPIATDMLAAVSDDRRAAMAAAVPMQRIGTPDEVAAAVRFLASTEAGFITGAVIPVDGGMGMGH